MTADPLRFIASDVGGTKTIVALYQRTGGVVERLALEVYPSQAHAGLSAILDSFRVVHPLPVERAVFAVAGPVDGRHATVTNLTWHVDAEALERRFAIPEVVLMNDVEALATVVPCLDPKDLHTLNTGLPVHQGTIAVVAPGTGLGEAYLTWCGSGYGAHATEGGHSDFAPATTQQIHLLQALLAERTHVSVEQVCSGSALPTLYRFLQSTSDLEEAPGVRQVLESVEDPTPMIVQAAVEARSALCKRTVSLFAEILGAELGSFALKVMATGGIYLGGGMPARMLPFLETEAFLNAFRSKGRFEAFLSRVPVQVILNSEAILRGAALRATGSSAG